MVNILNQPVGDKKSNILLHQPNLPKGGGSLGGLGESFSPNKFTGTASFLVQIPATSCRGINPNLSLNYNSGSGNGPFGIGFDVAITEISCKTNKGIPRYDGRDTFLLAGEDLVPIDGKCYEDGDYNVQLFHTRKLSQFDRIEYYTPKNLSTYDSAYWRVIDEEHIIRIFGKTIDAQINDPNNKSHVYKWLCQEVVYPKGDHIIYQYKIEEDGANKYIQKVIYGNDKPIKSAIINSTNGIENNGGVSWHFEVIFDYGEYDLDISKANLYESVKNWKLRADSFTSYNSSFAISTKRLCANILLFHRFDDEFGVNHPVLVKRLELSYDENPIVSKLKSIQETGYQFISKGFKDISGKTLYYRTKSLPITEYTYSEFDPAAHNYTKSIELDGSDVNLTNYNFFDLYGEGISGLLYSQNSTILYREPILKQGKDVGNKYEISYAPAKLLGKVPIHTRNGDNAEHHLIDVTGNGFVDWLVSAPFTSGYYELISSLNGKAMVREWQNFVPIEHFPTEFSMSFASLLDITGDSLSDCVINCGNKIRFYQSNGRRGFLPPQEVTYEQNSALPAYESAENIYIDYVDILGTGTKHLVRISNGDVTYWPNLGHGKFGAPKKIAGAPKIDNFNIKQLHLADIDGSGTVDLIYLHQDKLTVYYNQSGNSFANGLDIKLPDSFKYDNLTQAEFADIYGNGTQVFILKNLVTQKNVCYDFCQQSKPYLLTSINNNMGLVIKIHYQSSTYYYLKSKTEDKPWLTQLPFPVQVISKIEHIDEISKLNLVTTYNYMHGYYDGYQREFRGFGRVDKQDAEIVAGSDDRLAGYSAPLLSKTWYHTGYKLPDERLADKYSSEYFQGFKKAFPPLCSKFANMQDLSPEDKQQAYMALAGEVLRTEIYGLDNIEAPYLVHESSYQAKLLQKKNDNLYAIYFVHELELIGYDHEQKADDPRISHELLLEIDDYGNPTKYCKIYYGRFSNDALNEQKQIRMVLDLHEYVNDDNTGSYQLGVPCESRSYEVVDVKPPNPNWRFDIDEVKVIADNALKTISVAKPSSDICKLMSWERFIYAEIENDPTSTNKLLPLGQIASPLLLAQHQVAIYSAKEINAMYDGVLSNAELGHLLNKEGYLKLLDPDNKEVQEPSKNPESSYWWNIGLTEVFYNSNQFYLSYKVCDAQNNASTYSYDKYNLIINRVKDAIGNLTTLPNIDYQYVLPLVLVDMNQNISEVRLDPLGLVIYESYYSTKVQNGKELKTGFVPLVNFVIPDPENMQDVIDNRDKYISKAASYFFYDYFAWQNDKQPVYFTQIVATEYPSVWQEKATTAPIDTLQVHVGYTDGFSRSLQEKVLVEPGEAYIYSDNKINKIPKDTQERWLSTGRTYYNNKGQVIQVFEPYYINTSRYVSHDVLVSPVGYSHTNFYDPLGRAYKVITSKGFLTKCNWGPWEEVSWDENNAIVESPYYQVNVEGKTDKCNEQYKDPNFTGLDKQNLLDAAKYFNVSEKTVFDNLGHAIIKESTRNSKMTEERKLLQTYLRYDVLGRIISSSDPRLQEKELYNFQNFYGLEHSGILKTISADSGTHWLLRDYVGKSIFAYDEREISTRFHYDPIHRLVSIVTTNPYSEEKNKKITSVTEYYQYGDTDPELEEPENQNLRGNLYKHYHQSGISTNSSYNINGQVLESSLQLMVAYKAQADWQDVNNISKSFLEQDIYQDKYSYNAIGWALSKTNHFGDKTTNTYFISGRLQSVSVKTEKSTKIYECIKNITYNAKSQLEALEYGNGLLTKYIYDPQDWRLLHSAASLSNKTIYQLKYVYDSTGNIIERTSQPDKLDLITNKYIFNSLYQIIDASGVEQSEENSTVLTKYTERYNYDDAANLYKITHTADDKDKGTELVVADKSNHAVEKDSKYNTQNITAADVDKYFDKNGNIQQIKSLNLNWDVYNQLHQTRAGKTLEYYNYASLTHRSRKVTENYKDSALKTIVSMEKSIYLGGYELRTKSNITNDKEEIVDQRRILHAQCEQGNVVSIVQIEDKQIIHYHLKDALNSCNVEIDESGNIVNYEEFTPYGKTSLFIEYNKEQPKYYRYSDKERDEVTGLYFYGARYYAPWLGRWLNPDPAGYIDGLNLFTFVNSNPVTHVDIRGMVKRKRTHTQVPLSGANEQETTYGTFRSEAMESKVGELVLLNEHNFNILSKLRKNREYKRLSVQYQRLRKVGMYLDNKRIKRYDDYLAYKRGITDVLMAHTEGRLQTINIEELRQKPKRKYHDIVLSDEEFYRMIAAYKNSPSAGKKVERDLINRTFPNNTNEELINAKLWFTQNRGAFRRHVHNIIGTIQNGFGEKKRKQRQKLQNISHPAGAMQVVTPWILNVDGKKELAVTKDKFFRSDQLHFLGVT